MSKSCLNCTKRKVGCHTTCESYIQYKKEKEELNNKIKKQNQIHYDFYGIKRNKRR